MAPRVSLRNFATMSSALANDCSLPRGASRLSLSTEPSRKRISTRTLCREPAQRGDGGIVHHLDLARELYARRIVDAVGGELVDEHVAFEQKRGDAKRQIELRCGQTFGPVRPADVIDGDLRAVHDDLLDIVERKRPAGADVADGVERGVVAADAGIEFQGNAQGLEALTETGAQLREIEAVVRARERRAEAAIGRLEHINDAGETVLCQEGAVKPEI